MSTAVRSIVIVGGGSAGWITAGLIAAHHRTHDPDGVQVTLIESPNVPTIGVGEGTWPTMRSTLMKMGISETDFLLACDATFKQGAKFARWVDGGDADYYYHPLMLPQGFPRTDLAPYWHLFSDSMDAPPSFSQAVCFQEDICERQLAPKALTTPEYASIANYAYHLDAGKFGKFLEKHCTETLGVKHILADVTGIESRENGDIARLITEQAGRIDGDLFIDCTGFASLLLGKHFGVPFIDRSDVLFIDTALAIQVPYDREDAPIASNTIGTATSAGWIWDIGLPARRGIGHVFSSRYISEDEAVRQLHDYIGPGAKDLPVRKIPIRSGHRSEFWKNNCVAIGLSAGFLEPLEASALVLVELSATMIAEQLPAERGVMDIVARRYNEVFRYRWDRIIDFLKLHYILSKREDNRFWVDNRDPRSIPDSLKDQLALWAHRAPGDHDFTSNNEVFPAASYQYVLYGMGFKTDFRRQKARFRDEAGAKTLFAQAAEMKHKLAGKLPTNRALMSLIREHGLQRL